MGQSLMAFAANHCEYKNLYGAYWSQALSNGIQSAVNDGYDYIITCDYDSIFDTETVAQLIRLADHNPHADAICTVQMGRFSGLLVSTTDGTIGRKELETEPLVPVNTGHFGLTLLRVSALKDLKKPWFWSRPDEDGEWKKGQKLDDDIYFWDNFKSSGKQLYLAPRLVIGHLELLIKWPDRNMDGMYSRINDYYEHGKPGDCWE
jgi:hypothetical protein